MRLRLLALGLLTALTFLLPLSAADNKKKKDDPSLTPIDSDKLAAGDYLGKLLTMPGSDGTFTLQIDTQRFEPKNPAQLSAKESKLQGEIQTSQLKIIGIQSNLSAATKAKDIAKYTKQLQTETAHCQKLQAQSQIKPSDLKEVTDTKVFDLKLTNTADIRYMNLPMVFDDDGKAKKYTEAEKKELRGKKTNLPGYEGKLEDLQIGQTVKVTLVRISTKAKAPDAKTDDAPPEDAKKDEVKKPGDVKKPDDAKKDEPKDPADKPPPEKKMQVKMLVILVDAPADTKDTNGKKKPKN